MKPRVLSGDGIDIVEFSPQFGWHDTELDIDCFFAKAEDGVERCLPKEIGVGSTFADDNCSTLVGFGPRRCAPQPTYFTDDLGSGTCPGAVGYRVVRELPETTALYSKLGGTCEPSGLPPPPDSPIYELESVPAETFVEMQRVSRPYADGLDEWVREGDDGSWEVVAFYDQARAAPCASFPPGYEPARRCLPSFNDATSSFADEACETPAAEVGECEEATPAALGLAERSGDVCSSTTTYRFFEIGDEGETPTFAKDLDGSCVAYETTPVRTRTAGAAIPADAFPALEVVEAGAGRLHGRFHAAEGKPVLPVEYFPGPWLDSTTGQACSPERFADDSIRCVTYAGLSPDATTVQSIDVFYTSDSCSGERVVPWSSSTCSPDAATPERVVVPASDACMPAAVEVVAVTRTATPSNVYRTDDESGGCIPVDPVTLGTATFLVLGDTLDPAALFAEMTFELRE